MGNICGACGHDNGEDKRFCGECGEKLETEIVCSCGHVNKTGTRFCGECGQTLGAAKPAAKPVSNVVVKLDNANYTFGNEIKVSVFGITAEMKENKAFASIYKAGADHGDYGDYQYLQEGDSELTFTANVDAGECEMRVYGNGNQYNDETLLVTVRFIIAEEAVSAAELSLDKAAYTAGETIAVTVKGISMKMIKEKAFVSIYKAGAKHDDYGSYQYPKEKESTLTFSAPNEGGDYEFRLFRQDGQYDDSTLVTKESFAVVDSAVCAACGSKNKIGTKFCNDCGAKMSTGGKCSGCGSDNAAGTKFCNNCGTKL